MTTCLPCVQLEPGARATHSVIWLHGLGADGFDFPPLVPHLGLPEGLAVRFVFPHAPKIPVAINGNMVMPAWYDIRDGDLAKRHDEEGLRRSAAELVRLVGRENERGVPCERIVLAGFSQGGAVAAFAALRHAAPLGGLVLLSTYLVADRELAEERHAANAGLPIFQAHGTRDPMVIPERGRAARERLVELGYRVDWHEYPMEHSVCLEEAAELGRWLAPRLRA
jgi:phospholipase/carboxylesterase